MYLDAHFDFHRSLYQACLVCICPKLVYCGAFYALTKRLHCFFRARYAQYDASLFRWWSIGTSSVQRGLTIWWTMVNIVFWNVSFCSWIFVPTADPKKPGSAFSFKVLGAWDSSRTTGRADFLGTLHDGGMVLWQIKSNNGFCQLAGLNTGF